MNQKSSVAQTPKSVRWVLTSDSLHRQKVLPGSWRNHLAKNLIDALVNEADPSVFDSEYVETLLTEQEAKQAVVLAREKVLTNIPHYVGEMRSDWSSDYPPDDHFYTLETAIQKIKVSVEQAEPEAPLPDDLIPFLHREIRRAVDEMEVDYEPQSSTSAPVAASTPQNAVLHSLFRDVDE